MNVIDKKMINSPLYGEIQHRIRKKMQRMFGFDEWHVNSMYEKKYLPEIYKVLEALPDECKKKAFVEVGCGLGDIIGNIRTKGKKYGLDVSAEVINAAQILHRDVVFHMGSFEDIHVNEEIGCLIMVNFIHALSPDSLKKHILNVMSNHKVLYVLFDTDDRIKYSEYLFTHIGNDFLGEEYNCVFVGQNHIAAHGAYEHIELWKCNR